MLTKQSTVAIDPNKNYTFYVTPVPSARVYHFEAESDADCKAWVERIGSVCEGSPLDSQEEVVPQLGLISSLSSNILGSFVTKQKSCQRTIASFLGPRASDLLNDEFACSVCDKLITDHDTGGVDTSLALGTDDYLRDLVQRMMDTVEVKDRWYFGRLFEKCFLGCEAVAWLTSPFSCHCTADGVPVQRNLTEAVLLGNMLMSKGYFKHVTNGHPFKNERLFYRFVEVPVRVGLETCQACEFVFPTKVTDQVFECLRCHAKTDRTLELEREVRAAAQRFAERKEIVEGPVLRANMYNNGRSGGEDAFSLVALNEDEGDMADEALALLAERMKAGLEIKDRSWRFRTYKQCFLGSEAVKWLRDSSGQCKDTEHAIMIGNLMMARDLFQHVANAHPLKNEMLYYRFVTNKNPAVSNAFFGTSVAAPRGGDLLTIEDLPDSEGEDEEDEEDEDSELTIRIYEDHT